MNTGSERADRFVGRREELSALDGYVERGDRLVSIVGPPGIGKTRLVLELLAGIPDGEGRLAWHCFCDLGEIRDARELRSTVERLLGVEPRSRKGRLGPDAALARTLAARGCGLLVLDNVEQVTDAVGECVGEWLAAAPELRIFATSRERLRVAGEVCLDLGSLGLPSAPGQPDGDAVTLFVERARGHEPSFEVDQDNGRIVAELVTLLDGIPLAIELAAARVGVMRLDELRRRVATGIDVLSRGKRSTSARQSTLRSAVQWSWDLLSEVERDVLSRCAVFRGGFSLAAAESLLGEAAGGHPVLDALHALRDKSMLRTRADEAETRFDVYFGIREFAAEQLARSGRMNETRRRHAETYLTFAAAARAELERTGRSDDIRALARDRDNLMSAYEYLCSEDSDANAESVLSAVVALEPILSSRGPVERLLEMIDGYLARPDARTVGASTYARGLQARARALQFSGSLDAAEQDFDAALALLGTGADRWHEASLLVDVAVLHHQRRHFGRARDYYERALDLYEAGGSVRQQARVLGDIGALHHDQREFEVAEQYYRRALHLLRRAVEPRLEGNILGNLGLVALERGRFEEAGSFLKRAEAVLERASDQRLLGIVRGNRGALALELGDLETARDLLGLAIRDLAGFGDLSSQALCLARRAAVEATMPEAREWWTHTFAAERLVDAAEDPLTHAAVGLYGVLAELSSMELPSAETLKRVRARVTEARRPLSEGGSSLADLSDDVRAALRLLERRLSRIEPLLDVLGDLPDDALVMGPDAAWFRPPGGVSQSLRSHGPVRRILLALASEARDAARLGLSLEALREIGWPGERIGAEAAANRVHVALAELRRRGLKAYIVRLSRGYSLADGLTVHRSDAPFPERV